MFDWTKHFLELFQKLVDKAEGSGNQLKILALGYELILLTLQSMLGQTNRIVSIQRLHPVPPHLRRQFASRGNNIHLTGRQKLKSRFKIDFLSVPFCHFKSAIADRFGIRFIEITSQGNARNYFFSPLGTLETQLPYAMLYYLFH